MPEAGCCFHRLAMLLPALMLLPACSPPVDESAKIRETIASMEMALEAGQARRFASYLVEDFQGQDGISNRRTARAFVGRQLVSQQKVRVQLGPLRIQLNEGNPFYASAGFEALLLGGPGLLPASGRLYRVESKWRKEDGDWLLVSAAWQIALGSR